MNTLLKSLQVREKLLEKGVRTFTPRDFERIFGASPTQTKYFLESKTDEGLFARLKQGVYALKTDLPSEAEIANSLYRPSYISFEYALAYYGLIPEMPYAITSATTKPTREFTANNLSFAYYTIKREAYTGYMPLLTMRSISEKGTIMNHFEIDRSRAGTFLIAEPEKAFVDVLYFVALGKRQLNERIDEADTLDKEKLRKYAALYNRKRLNQLLEEFL
jgi:predicted transcriptional regulator of viral defense system